MWGGGSNTKPSADVEMAVTNPAELKKALSTRFKEIDTDSSGAIDKGEVMKEFQSRFVSVTAKDIDDLWTNYDANGNGVLDMDEFVQLGIDLDAGKVKGRLADKAYALVNLSMIKKHKKKIFGMSMTTIGIIVAVVVVTAGAAAGAAAATSGSDSGATPAAPTDEASTKALAEEAAAALQMKKQSAMPPTASSKKKALDKSLSDFVNAIDDSNGISDYTKSASNPVPVVWADEAGDAMNTVNTISCFIGKANVMNAYVNKATAISSGQVSGVTWDNWDGKFYFISKFDGAKCTGDPNPQTHEWQIEVVAPTTANGNNDGDNDPNTAKWDVRVWEPSGGLGNARIEYSTLRYKDPATGNSKTLSFGLKWMFEQSGDTTADSFGYLDMTMGWVTTPAAGCSPMIEGCDGYQVIKYWETQVCEGGPNFSAYSMHYKGSDEGGSGTMQMPECDESDGTVGTPTTYEVVYDGTHAYKKKVAAASGTTETCLDRSTQTKTARQWDLFTSTGASLDWTVWAEMELDDNSGDKAVLQADGLYCWDADGGNPPGNYGPDQCASFTASSETDVKYMKQSTGTEVDAKLFNFAANGAMKAVGYGTVPVSELEGLTLVHEMWHAQDENGNWVDLYSCDGNGHCNPLRKYVFWNGTQWEEVDVTDGTTSAYTGFQTYANSQIELKAGGDRGIMLLAKSNMARGSQTSDPTAASTFHPMLTEWASPTSELLQDATGTLTLYCYEKCPMGFDDQAAAATHYGNNGNSIQYRDHIDKGATVTAIDDGAALETAVGDIDNNGNEIVFLKYEYTLATNTLTDKTGKAGNDKQVFNPDLTADNSWDGTTFIPDSQALRDLLKSSNSFDLTKLDEYYSTGSYLFEWYERGQYMLWEDGANDPVALKESKVLEYSHSGSTSVRNIDYDGAKFMLAWHGGDADGLPELCVQADGTFKFKTGYSNTNTGNTCDWDDTVTDILLEEAIVSSPGGGTDYLMKATEMQFIVSPASGGITDCASLTKTFPSSVSCSNYGDEPGIRTVGLASTMANVDYYTEGVLKAGVGTESVAFDTTSLSYPTAVVTSVGSDGSVTCA